MNSINLAAPNSVSNLSTITNNSNVKVYIRLRPICHKKSELPIDYEFNKTEIQIKKTNQQTRTYCFDGIFGHQSIQQDLSDVIDGFNCTVLAYGQTGTGKTYTIEGDYLQNIRIPLASSLSTNNSQQLPNQAGLVPRAFYKLFNRLKPEDQFKVSVIEIYNEEVFDLLSDHSESIRLYESQKGVTLSHLKEFVVNDSNDLNIILQKSNSKRQFASTLMNKRSSRSHVIFQFVYSTKETLKNNHVVERVGKLNLVDLAGSECAKRTGCQDQRALEAGNINRSLLTLTRVIDALVKNQKYIPFRSSNLTRIIQDTLGGNSKTILIATLSPALIDFEDTINTLTFASTVKQVKNHASANVKIIQNNYYEERLKELEENLLLEQNKHDEQIIQMKLEIERIKNECESKDNDRDELKNQLETKSELINNLKRDINKLNDELISSTHIQQENPCKEPNAKKQRTKKPLSNSSDNDRIRKSNRISKIDSTSEEVFKPIKSDVNALLKDQKELTKKINKLHKSLMNLEVIFKEFDKKKMNKRLICGDHLEEDLSSFMFQMFNITIQDEFDLFYEFLGKNVLPELSENLGHQLDEQFTDFTKYVYEKLELVKETTDNTINLKEEDLKKKTEAINEINEISSDLKKEMSDVLKTYKKCKDKANQLKNSVS